MSAHQWAAQATTPNAGLVRHGTASVVVLRVTEVALAAICLTVGGAILTGTPPMADMFAVAGRTSQVVNIFNAAGLGLWFYYVTGVSAIAAAIALLIPSTALYGALLLIPIMIGAIADNVFILHASPVAPLVLLIGATGVALACRKQFLRVIQSR